ncbi:snurportin-1-like [Uloborus diversus]|uniref:snurportin-1-like n=1 Tax=Uloborus diversus TaxID=327109 RepID=UPI0024096AEC|nr:snurportin-1-like [Uloborus diversus]
MGDIDSLTEAFAISQVAKSENSTAAPHPYFSSLYKKKSSITQEERRKRFLEAQKQKRFDYAKHARRLATSEWSDGDEYDENDDEEMDCEEYIRKPSRSYKNQLMLSEWLVEVPNDLAEEWTLVLCPVGKRCLVISTRGVTKAYARNGYFLQSFQSFIPGGSRQVQDVSGGAYTILDCIYVELTKTYYVLDVMCWNSHPLYDSETEFRFFWKSTKFEENAAVQSEAKNNPYKFIPLPHYNCDTESIRNTLHSPLPFDCKLDGLLFFHKRSHYLCGTSPLVTWLKPYMVPEILSIEVPASLCTDRPADYVCMQQHLPKAFKKNEERKNKEELNMQYEDDG